MAIKVTLRNSSQTTSSNVNLVEDDLNITRLLYQRLGSLVLNKTIKEDIDNGAVPPAFLDIMNELSELHNFKYYSSNIVIPSSIEALDSYLGSLGITEEYTYSKDFNNISPWVTTTSQTEYRVLHDNDIILTDGEDILLYYT